MITTNQRAFLDMIATSELNAAVLADSDNGYNVLVGSVPGAVNTFPSYVDHPRQSIWLPRLQVHSTAAGRYQILARNFDYYRNFLQLGDFGPDSQDAIAIQLIRECHALNNIEAGKISLAITECSREWASLPGNSYGQHKNNMQDLCTIYCQAGGLLT